MYTLRSHGQDSFGYIFYVDMRARRYIQHCLPCEMGFYWHSWPNPAYVFQLMGFMASCYGLWLLKLMGFMASGYGLWLLGSLLLWLPFVVWGFLSYQAVFLHVCPVVCPVFCDIILVALSIFCDRSSPY